MKKIWSKILIGFVMLSIFLAPVSAGINKAEAQGAGKWYYEYKTSTLGIESDNQIAGPFDTLADCQADTAGGGISVGTIIRLCFQSDTFPTVTPAADTDTAIAATGLTDPEFGCGLKPWTWHKCIISWIYYLVFQPLAFFARLSAKILDFFIYYSTNSDSYTSDFVDKGWGAVRDIANIFFIVALLYVAIKTILSLNVGNNKKIVGTIIIVALFINFSLFTTKVVIDASNILAKIFYNNIKSVDENNNPLPPGGEQEKSITVGLVKVFNPQEIFIKSNTSIADNIGIFAAVLLISILLMGYMIYMFISVTMLFVARVISLWLSMIFSPIAFASYTMDVDMGGLGHSKWWSELFKNAFLAPIFIFFLYIIILFGDFMTIVTYGDSSSGYVLVPDVNSFQTYMKTLIPFIIIFALLMKAKKIAVEYSGEMGAAMVKAGAMVGGLALGAVTGGAAMAGRATLGRAGAALANNSRVKNWASKSVVGDVFQKGMMKMGSGSMDLRGVKIAGKGLGDTGFTNLGKAKEGGFTKMRADRVEKRVKRAKELEVGEDEALKQNLNKAEGDLQSLLKDNSGTLEKLDKQIAAARENLRDARAADDGTAISKDRITRYDDQIKAFGKQKNALRKGEDIDISYADYDDKGAVIIKNIKEKYSTVRTADGKSIHKLETEDVADAKKAIKLENNKRRGQFADYVSRERSKFTDHITGLGQYSSKGADEAAHKIRMEIKLDSGDKGH